MIYSDTFKLQLDRFYNEALKGFGYQAGQQQFGAKPLSGEGVDYKFLQPEKNLEIYISFSKLLREAYAINFLMFEVKPNSNSYEKVFELDKFKRKNEFKQIIHVSEPGQNIEQFLKEYFDSVIEACRTYLRDQISGVSFEEHPKYPDEM